MKNRHVFPERGTAAGAGIKAEYTVLAVVQWHPNQQPRCLSCTPVYEGAFLSPP